MRRANTKWFTQFVPPGVLSWQKGLEKVKPIAACDGAVFFPRKRKGRAHEDVERCSEISSHEHFCATSETGLKELTLADTRTRQVFHRVSNAGPVNSREETAELGAICARAEGSLDFAERKTELSPNSRPS